MKKKIFFLMLFCALLISAQNKSSSYNIELNLSTIELTIDSGAMEYEKYFREAYDNPYRSIEVKKEHKIKPGWPKAWPEKNMSFITYYPDESRLGFHKLEMLPTSIYWMIFCLALMSLCLILIPFFNDDMTTHFMGIIFIIFAIPSFIGALIMRFPLTLVFVFLSFVSMLVTSDMSYRENKEEQVKFYIAWIINVLLLGIAITFFILGK